MYIVEGMDEQNEVWRGLEAYLMIRELYMSSYSRDVTEAALHELFDIFCKTHCALQDHLSGRDKRSPVALFQAVEPCVESRESPCVDVRTILLFIEKPRS